MLNATPSPSEHERGTPRERAARWLVLAISTLIILLSARGDLYNDELWSLSFARKANSWFEIFARFRHDNNHPLNTLYLYLVGDQSLMYVYRLLAVATGIGSVMLVGRIAAREWGPREALWATAFTGISYPLVLYFSEARGYAPAMFFALASYASLRWHARQPGILNIALYWVCTILGTLSHATFVMATMAFCIGSLASGFRAGKSLRHAFISCAVIHAVPLAFFACWYRYFVKNMEIGGGALETKWDVFSQGATLLLGIPEMPILFGVAMIAAAAIIVGGLIFLRRDKNPQWLFFAAILCVSPAALLIASRPVYLYFRYFIVCYPFFYLLLAYIVCKSFQRCATPGRLVLSIAIAATMTGHMFRDYRLIRLGRGQYSNAITYISKASSGLAVRVGSDHDFRNRLIFDFYVPRLSEASNIHYINTPEWAAGLPDWLLVHSQSLSYRPQDELTIRGPSGDIAFRFDKAFRYSGVSGWNWFVYRRVTPKGN